MHGHWFFSLDKHVRRPVHSFPSSDQIAQGIPEPKNSVYIGESSRTAFTRYHQHVRDYTVASNQNPQQHEDQEDRSSFMMDHSRAVHGGHHDHRTDYSIKVLSSHRDPLSGQSTEAVRISRALRTGIHTNSSWKEVHVNSLNRKGEFFSPVERFGEEV